jgi:branched-chain amino acid transport system substrate-binding protein
VSEHGQAIRIGVLFPQEGVMAVTERAMLEGVMLAIAEINEGGGVGGRPLSPVVVNPGASRPPHSCAADHLCRSLGCRDRRSPTCRRLADGGHR